MLFHAPHIIIPGFSDKMLKFILLLPGKQVTIE